MQIWCAEGSNHGVWVSHGGDKRGIVSPCCNACLYSGNGHATSSEYLLMTMIKLKKLSLVVLMNMK